MTPILEDAALENDLDCQNYVLQNVRALYPVPPGLVAIDDPTLYDPRVPPFGSVTDESVSPTAGIVQSKLNLSDTMPAVWLGLAAENAAPGDQVERLSRKGVPNGYAALDASGRIPSSAVPATGVLGTINSIGLSMTPELNVAGSPITVSGDFTVSWKDAPDQSWLGVNGATDLSGELKPSFVANLVPPGMVSDLDASQFTSGIFDRERIPVAVGMGVGASTGIVPDPGDEGLPSDYLGRDMEWHTFAVADATMPTCPAPLITLDSWSEAEVLVTVRSTLPGSSLFIRINNSQFKQSKIEHHDKLFPDVHDTISVQDGDIVWAYSARAGYNNSPVNNWRVVTPLTNIP